MTIDRSGTHGHHRRGRHLRKTRALHRQSWLRPAQSGVSAAYFRRRRLRNGDARLRHPQPQSLQRLLRRSNLVTANGDRLTLSRAKDAEHFDGAVVALGALGIVTSLTLDLEPTYQVEQVVYQDLPFAELEHNLDAIFAQRLQRKPLHGLAEPARHTGLDQAPCRARRSPTSGRRSSTTQSARRRSCTPSRATLRSPAPSSLAFRGRGMSGCRTSA